MVTDDMAALGMPSFGVVPPQVAKLASRMRRGVPCKDRTHKGKVFNNCFLGKDAVAWLVANTQHSAKEAVVLGGMMIKHKLMYHVLNKEQKLKNNKAVLYRWGLELGELEAPVSLHDAAGDVVRLAGTLLSRVIVARRRRRRASCESSGRTNRPHRSPPTCRHLFAGDRHRRKAGWQHGQLRLHPTRIWDATR